MYLGRVIGTIVATRKISELAGHRLLLVQPLDHAQAQVGPVQVAVDTVQAGTGDLVTLVGSREASAACGNGAAVDAAIVGIVDGLAVDEAP